MNTCARRLPGWIACLLVVFGLAPLLPTAFTQPQPDDSKSGGYLRQSPAIASGPRAANDFGLGDHQASRLKEYPPGGPGDRTPFDLWRYAGRGRSSWG